MKQLGPEARELIETVGDADGPAPGTRERVRAALGATLAASAALGSSAAFGAQAAAGAGSNAKLLGLGALSGKGSTAIALWFVAGGAAGMAVATPLALVSARPSPAIVTPAPKNDQARLPLHRPRSAMRAAAPAASAPAENHNPTPALRPALARVEAQRPAPSATLTSAAPAAPTVATSDVATELALLKAAQRDLNAANATASLALLDDHARRYPDGALKAERLAARVFALCQLGRVDQARAAALEFMNAAGDSPLVPRVLASCAGKGTETPR